MFIKNNEKFEVHLGRGHKIRPGHVVEVLETVGQQLINQFDEIEDVTGEQKAQEPERGKPAPSDKQKEKVKKDSVKKASEKQADWVEPDK